MQPDLVEQMYMSKQPDYFSIEREIFKNAVKGTNLSILDVGCGTGSLGKYFRTHQQCKVYGVEINQEAYLVAKENLDEVIKGNVENIDLPYDKNSFDVVIMGDVLEHLINPAGAIGKLMQFVKPGGRILITVPNVRHWKVMYGLIFKDEWKYMSWGILDYTHLRFFTKTSIVAMMIDNGFKVAGAERVIQKRSKSSVFNNFTFQVFSGFLASHTFLILEK